MVESNKPSDNASKYTTMAEAINAGKKKVVVDL
jgi:hypothetical protein